MWSYKSNVFIDDPGTGLRIVGFSVRVIRVCSGLVLDVYDSYRLLECPPDVIDSARQLSMVVALGLEANVAELLELLDVIQ